MLHQGEVEGVGLKALQHHQRIHRGAHTGLKQHISGVARCQHPFQARRATRGFVVQGTALFGGGQQGTGLIAPGGAALGAHGSHHRGQLGCGFAKGWPAHHAKCPAPRAEQRPCRQGVARHVARKVITRSSNPCSCPAQLRVVSKRGQTPAETAAPKTLGPRHELGVRHQHHGARQMRALGLRMGATWARARCHTAAHGAVYRSLFAMTVIASRDAATR